MVRCGKFFARIHIAQMKDEPISAGLRYPEWRVTGFLCAL